MINSFQFPVAVSTLVAHYAGENNVNDSSGNGRNGTAGGSMAYTTGQTGNCFNITSNASAFLTPILNIGGNYSIEFYARRPVNDGNVYHHLISRAYDSATQFGALYWVDSGIVYWWNGAAIVSTNSAGGLSLNTWYKIKITYSLSGDKKTRLYVDDVLTATEGGTHTETATNSIIGIGRANPLESFSFDGRMDEIKFYNAIV